MCIRDSPGAAHQRGDRTAQSEQQQPAQPVSYTHLDVYKRQALACARLHHHRLQHSCLYGKHLFVRRSPAAGPDYQEADVRFIDLEKLRLGLSRERVSAHDLDPFCLLYTSRCV